MGECALRSRVIHTRPAYYSKNFFFYLKKLQGVGMKEEWPLKLNGESEDQNKIKMIYSERKTLAIGQAVVNVSILGSDRI